MGALLIRTAYSINIKERHDASTAIFDHTGRLVAQAEHIPIHLGAMLSAIRHVLNATRVDDPAGRRVSRERCLQRRRHASRGRDGRFARIPRRKADRFRREHGSLARRRRHEAAAAMTEGCTEIYQEGLRIPPMRVMREGVLDQNLFSFILLNMRFAEDRPAICARKSATNEAGVRADAGALHEVRRRAFQAARRRRARLQRAHHPGAHPRAA